MYPIDFFFRAAQAYPDHIAVQSTSAKVSYRDLARSVRALACQLQQIDPSPGSRVGLCATNCPDYVAAMLAIMAAGKVWVPLNYRSTTRETARILDTVTPTVVIVDDAGDRLLEQRDAITRLHMSEFPAIYDAHAGKAPLRHEFSRDDTQAIKFTGGTTGIPKGVMQPYRAWVATIINQIAGWQITSADKFVVGAPLSHGTGTYVLPLVAQGGCLLIADSGDPQTLVDAFSKHGGTMTFMPPTLIYKLMALPGATPAAFSSLRLMIYGGAPMPAAKIAAAQDFFGPVVATTFGQTEAPQIATQLTPDVLMDEHYRASVGRVTWFSDVAIVSPDGERLPAGEKGEVLIRGDLVMSGYWQQPELTAATIKDGWLHTGDVGYLDERGFLFLKERLRDVIISGGFNVYPVDVEDMLSQHEAVHEAAVFGVPDEKWGEAVHAAVECKPGQQVDAAVLQAFVRERLGPVLTPKHIYFYDTLPRSSVGKVLKTEIRKQASHMADVAGA